MDSGPWRVPGTPPLEEVVAIACRAPSVHNTQPWLWRASGDRLELLADWSRHLPHADPDGRDLVISCGAALHHARVAAAGLGWTTDVDYRRGAGWDPGLASLVLTRTTPDRTTGQRLAAMLDRQTDRRPFVEDATPHLAAHLAHRGRRRGVDVQVAPPWLQARVLELVGQADALQRADPGYVRELSAWTRDGLREGVPAANLPRPGSRSPDGPPVTLRFPAGRLAPPPVAEPAPGRLLVVTSGSDDLTSWLHVGEALSDLWIEATRLGLSLVPLSQVTEVRSTRRALAQALLDGLPHPQIAACVGWLPLERTPLPRSPRRSLDDVLVRTAAS